LEKELFMAETTLLRTSAITRNVSIGASPSLGPVKMGELPLVQVKMAPGGPQVMSPQQKAVEILPPRDANAALHTGGLPMVCVKMTSQGPQLDDGQDKAVVILRPKDQKHAIAAGGLPMVQVKMAPGGPQVQNQPAAQKAPPQIQGPQPAVSQPWRVQGAAPPVNQARVVRVVAPKQVPLPPVPEFTADQLMLCRHLVGRYLADLRVVDPAVQGAAESVESGGSAESAGSTDVASVAKEAPESDNVHLAAATIEMIDQTLVAVAVRAEVAALEAANASTVLEDQASPAFSPVPVTSSAVSIVPAAPSASYVAGRVGGGRTNGYSGPRWQRNAAMAPRRVPRPGVLPPVIVKMDGGRAVVQNQAEVAAARAAAQSPPVSEGVEASDGSA
jgi:hypothetical protein